MSVKHISEELEHRTMGDALMIFQLNNIARVAVFVEP